MIVSLLAASIGTDPPGVCSSQRDIDLKSRDDLISAEEVCGYGRAARGCFTRVDCAKTNAPCTTSDPIFVPKVINEDQPWKYVFGGKDAIPSIKDRHLQSNVIPPGVWWRLPRAILLYARGAKTPADDGCDASHSYCVVPAHRLACTRARAPDHTYPVPGYPMGTVDGKELLTFQKECGITNNLYNRNTITLGLYRADLTFDWIGLSTASFEMVRWKGMARVSAETLMWLHAQTHGAERPCTAPPEPVDGENPPYALLTAELGRDLRAAIDDYYCAAQQGRADDPSSPSISQTLAVSPTGSTSSATTGATSSPTSATTSTAGTQTQAPMSNEVSPEVRSLVEIGKLSSDADVAAVAPLIGAYLTETKTGAAWVNKIKAVLGGRHAALTPEQIRQWVHAWSDEGRRSEGDAFALATEEDQLGVVRQWAVSVMQTSIYGMRSEGKGIVAVLSALGQLVLKLKSTPLEKYKDMAGALRRVAQLIYVFVSSIFGTWVAACKYVARMFNYLSKREGSGWTYKQWHDSFAKPLQEDMSQAVVYFTLYAQLSEKALLMARGLLGGSKQLERWKAPVEFMPTPKKLREVRRGLESKLDSRRLVSCYKRICAGYLDPAVSQQFVAENMGAATGRRKLLHVAGVILPRRGAAASSNRPEEPLPSSDDEYTQAMTEVKSYLTSKGLVVVEADVEESVVTPVGELLYVVVKFRKVGADGRADSALRDRAHDLARELSKMPALMGCTVQGCGGHTGESTNTVVVFDALVATRILA